ncbi:insulinase family protein [Sessilibacter sp. MAH1]
MQNRLKKSVFNLQHTLFKRFISRSNPQSTAAQTVSTSPQKLPKLKVLVVMAVASTISWQSFAVTIQKGDIDDREYRYFELENGLKAVVIHDETADKAAAALDVFVGSNDNPDDRLGLAHFLEHMLFLGTKKYPEPDAYQDFVSKNGGNHNAFTSSEHTNYFFEVKASALPETLDRFAQFFIAPLFTQAYVDRERKAVNSEYSANIKDDFRRNLDAYREVVNPEHPLSKFSVGSLATLANRVDDPVREDLIAFYRKYYSADQMTLVVLGKESLDELQTLVTNLFSDVKKNRAEVIREGVPLFEEGKLPLMLSTVPEKDGHRLTMMFSVPPTLEYFRKKPLSYIGNLVGHEGEGSLLDVLKKQGWAENLSAGDGLSDRFNGSFLVSIQLTDEGLAHKDEVVGLFFAEIENIKKSGLNKWRFNEQAKIADIDFRFSEKQSPSGTVSFLAGVLQELPPENILNGGSLYEKFDKKLIKSYLAEIKPENLFLHLSSKTVEADKKSDYYYTPYSVESLKGKEWPVDKDLVAQLALPKKNPFIATDLALVKDTQDSEIPELIGKNSLDVWFKTDTSYEVPRGVVNIRFLLPNVAKDIKGAVMLDLFENMVEESLQSYSYPASLAGLNFGLGSNSRGFDLRIGGYSDKQDELIKRIIEQLQDFDNLASHYDVVKNQLERAWTNNSRQTPYSQIFADAAATVFSPKWTIEEKLAVLKTINLDDLKPFTTSLFAGADTEVLVFGNFTKNDATNIAALIDANLLKGAKNNLELPKATVVKLPIGDTWSWLDVEHPDNALVGYLQGQGDSLEDQAKMMLLEQAVDAGFYNRLRTDQQLGYIVATTSMQIKNVPATLFIVQSPTVPITTIKAAMLEYLKTFNAAENFEQNKEAIKARLLEAPKNLFEQSEIYWDNIAFEQKTFDRDQQLANLIDKMTVEEFVDFTASVVKNGQWLWFAAATTEEKPEEIKFIDDIQAFKNKADKYQYQ